MEAFSLFCTVFFNVVIIFGLLLCIYLYFFSGLRAFRKLKPSCYISYKKNHFDEDFEFTCEFCGSVVTSRDSKCPKCAGDFKNFLKKFKNLKLFYIWKNFHCTNKKNFKISIKLGFGWSSYIHN